MKPFIEPPEPVAVPYRELGPHAQFDFRRGFYAGSGVTKLPDEALHKALCQKGLIRLSTFRVSMTKTFSLPFSLGFCAGVELNHRQKVQLLGKSHELPRSRIQKD